MSHLETEKLKFEEKSLYVPELSELKTVIQGALSGNFETATVDVTACPNLSERPYGLKAAGLGGAPALLEVGGPPYLLPTVQRDKLYNVKQIARKCLGAGKIFALGAGAGPYLLRSSNCEGIFNMAIGADDKLDNGSYTATVRGADEQCTLQSIANDEERCALLLNLYLCRGEPGQVLKVKATKRTGEQNFIECIRKGLAEYYGEQCVGLGGIFLIKRGSAWQHVMRDFSTTPINTEDELNNWLKFYSMPAQLNAVGTLITHENDLDLRLQHFHSFSFTNWGGHYHNDDTPEEADYEAYLNVAERVIRVDRPLETHKFGRD